MSRLAAAMQSLVKEHAVGILEGAVSDLTGTGNITTNRKRVSSYLVRSQQANNDRSNVLFNEVVSAFV